MGAKQPLSHTEHPHTQANFSVILNGDNHFEDGWYENPNVPGIKCAGSKFLSGDALSVQDLKQTTSDFRASTVRKNFNSS
eukprot:907636-Pelagomonas_calceolata.AAC.3